MRAPPVFFVRSAHHMRLAFAPASSETYDAQKKDTLAKTRPTTIPGAEKIMIFRRPMMSMYFSAKRVKTKLVPETIKPTAVG